MHRASGGARDIPSPLCQALCFCFPSLPLGCPLPLRQVVFVPLWVILSKEKNHATVTWEQGVPPRGFRILEEGLGGGHI